MFLNAVVLTTFFLSGTAFYCVPDEDCWPTAGEIQELRGYFGITAFFTPGNLGYPFYQRVNTNLNVIKKPAFIALVENVEDIRKCLDFIRVHRLQTTIVSSGHSYIGRNTADNSFQINVHRMHRLNIDLTCSENPEGCVTVEAGVQFSELYKAVDGVDRIVPGGADPSVSISGWTLGGGHSPVVRQLALGIDNVLEFTMIIADGHLATVNERETIVESPNGTVETLQNTDLFWALRGGGGSTFGIVTSFKFRLHKPPDSFVVIACGFPMFQDGQPSIIRKFLEWYTVFVQELPDRFGGYLLSSLSSKGDSSSTSMTLALIHYGNMSLATPTLNQLNGNLSEMNLPKCTSISIPTFWEVSKFLPQSNYMYMYTCGSLLQPELITQRRFTDTLTNWYNMTFHSQGSLGNLNTNFNHIGGKSKNFGNDSSPINNGLRTAIWSVGFSTYYELPTTSFKNMKHHLDNICDSMLPYSKGTYYNECGNPTPSWKEAFWGNNYDRLLKIKQVWDPTKMFSCHQCVGDGWLPTE